MAPWKQSLFISALTKKHTSMVLTCHRDMRVFSGRCEFCVFHCILCRFCLELYWKHHVTSPVMTLWNISALRKRSDGMWSRRCIWSCVKTRGHNFCGKISRSQILLYNLSHCFPIHIQFCCCSHTWSSHQGSYSVHICICPLSFWLPTSWVVLHTFSPFLEPPVPFKNTRFLHSIFTISHC